VKTPAGNLHPKSPIGKKVLKNTYNFVLSSYASDTAIPVKSKIGYKSAPFVFLIVQ